MDVLESLFCAGSAAVVTVTFIHPVDLLKTRMQISGVNGARNYKALGVLGTVKTIAKEEGVAAFWKGIPAAWLRESSYTSLRLGLYQPCKVLLGADAKDAPFIKKFAAGGIAGGIGSIAGNPFDVLKTKMMAAEGKQVLSFADNVRSIFHSQGIRGFYQGIDANIARAMVNNGTKMACYDTTKQLLKASGVFGKDGIALQFSSGMVAGFFITCMVAPFDMIRTRLMNQPMDGPQQFKNFADCAVKITKEKGVLSLWNGFIPMWTRVAPTATLQLIFFEQISSMVGRSAI